jgi:hypothetical protein
LVTAEWTAFQTESILIDKSEPSAGWDVLVPVVVIYPLLLMLFSKIYKWTNWREKLIGDIKVTNIEHKQNIGNHDDNI